MGKRKDIFYNIDKVIVEDDKLMIDGWANCRNPHDKIIFSVQDDLSNPIEHSEERFFRNDASMARYGKAYNESYGFSLSCRFVEGRNYFLKLASPEDTLTIAITSTPSHSESRMNHLLHKNSQISQEKINEFNSPYAKWQIATALSPEDLTAQRIYYKENAHPKITILISCLKAEKSSFLYLLQSIYKQTYINYEVLLLGPHYPLSFKYAVAHMTHSDTRFSFKKCENQSSMADLFNEGIQDSSGDCILFIENDAVLAPNTLFEYAKALSEQSGYGIAYSDDDKFTDEGNRFICPFYKPDFDADLLCSTNYIGSSFAVKSSLLREYGSFDAHTGSACLLDFILKMSEHGIQICHMQKVLYHSRLNVKECNAEDEQKAVIQHYERQYPSIQIDHIEPGISEQIHHLCFSFQEQPLVSIIIPNKDHISDLDQTIHSVIEKTTWKNLEFIVIENNSIDADTFEYYQKIQKEFPIVSVINYEGDFNYSRINNYGVQHAHGKYLLFMNNDIEMIAPDSINEMVGYAQRADVGAVGCRLLYPDNTIQHAGVIVGIEGVAGHAFRGCTSENTYQNLAMTVRDYSAVTAAVMMVRKEIFQSINGFDETFAIAFNDVDFCLRLKGINKKVVYDPYAVFYHYESKSRGLENTDDKKLRFISELQRFVIRWHDFILSKDPCYNPNLSVHREDFSLNNPGTETYGEQYYTPQQMKDIMTKTPQELLNII